MEYIDFPQQEQRAEIFEPSENNYFFCSTKSSYLCSYDQVLKANRFTVPGSQVLVTYKRKAVIAAGKVVFENKSFTDGHTCESMMYKDLSFVIISEKTNQYFVHSWNKYMNSYVIRDCEEYNQALHPRIYKTSEDAIDAAVKLSLTDKGRYVVAQWFAECDRYMGNDSAGYYTSINR